MKTYTDANVILSRLYKMLAAAIALLVIVLITGVTIAEEADLTEATADLIAYNEVRGVALVATEEDYYVLEDAYFEEDDLNDPGMYIVLILDEDGDIYEWFTETTTEPAEEAESIGYAHCFGRRAM